MPDETYVDLPGVRRNAEGVRRIRNDLADAVERLNTLSAELEGCWGGDDIGRAFGEKYSADSGDTRADVGRTTEGLRFYADNLEISAQNLSLLDEDNASRIPPRVAHRPGPRRPRARWIFAPSRNRGGRTPAMAGRGGATELPDSLQTFFKVVLGMEWPEGNEANLRELSAAWADLAAALERAALDARRSGDALDDVLRGDTGSANAKLIGEDYSADLAEMARGADEFRKATKNAAADIEKGKIMLVVMAAMTLAAVIELLVSLFGAIFVPAVLAAARVGLWALLRQMVQQMVQAVARLGLNKATAQTLLRGVSKALTEATKKAAIYGAAGVGLMAGLDGLIQVGQNGAGDREGYDLDSIGHSAIGGAIGGAGAGLTRAAAGGVRSWSDDAVRRLDLARPVGDPHRGVARHVRVLGVLGYAGAQILTAPASGAVINAVFGENSNPFFGAVGALGGMGGRPTGPLQPVLDRMETGPSKIQLPWVVSGGPGDDLGAPTTSDGAGPTTGTPSSVDDGDSSAPSQSSGQGGPESRPPLVIPTSPTVASSTPAPVPATATATSGSSGTASGPPPLSSAAGARPEPASVPANSSAAVGVGPANVSTQGGAPAPGNVNTGDTGGRDTGGRDADGRDATENSAPGSSAPGSDAPRGSAPSRPAAVDSAPSSPATASAAGPTAPQPPSGTPFGSNDGETSPPAASVSEGRDQGSTTPGDTVGREGPGGRGTDAPGAATPVQSDGAVPPARAAADDGPLTSDGAPDTGRPPPVEAAASIGAVREATADSAVGLVREPVRGEQDPTVGGDAQGPPPRTTENSSPPVADGRGTGGPVATPQPPAASSTTQPATTPPATSGTGRDTAATSGAGRSDATPSGQGSGANTPRSAQQAPSTGTSAGEGRTVGGESATRAAGGGRDAAPTAADGARSADTSRSGGSPLTPSAGDRATWETSGSPFTDLDRTPPTAPAEPVGLPAVVSSTPATGTPPPVSTSVTAGSAPAAPAPTPSSSTPTPPSPAAPSSSPTPAPPQAPTSAPARTGTEGAPPAAPRTDGSTPAPARTDGSTPAPARTAGSGGPDTIRTGDPASGEHRPTTARGARTPDPDPRVPESRPAESGGRSRSRDRDDGTVVLPVPTPDPAEAGPPAPRRGDDGGRSAAPRPEHGAPVTPVRFRESTTSIGEDARGPIRDATDAFVRDVLATPPDRRAPAMTITGHGNGTTRRAPWSVDGTGTGRARADAVRAVVLERLDELAREGGLGGRDTSEFRVLARTDATPLTSGALRDTNRIAIIDYTTEDVTGPRSESTVTFSSGQHRPGPGADADIVALAGQVRERLRDGGPVRVEIVGDGTGRPAQRLAHRGGALIESSGRVAKTRLGSAEKWTRDLLRRRSDDPRPPGRWVVRPPSAGPESLLQQRRAAGRERADAVGNRLRDLLGPHADRVHIATRSAVDPASDGPVGAPSRSVRVVVEQVAQRPPEADGRGGPGGDGVRRNDGGGPRGSVDGARSDVALAGAPVSVRFAEGVHRIASRDRAAVERATDAWIDAVVAARAAGGPTPALVITGHGNGARDLVRPWADRTGTEVTGRDRAHSVHDVAEKRLADRLRTDRAGGLAREDFRIVSGGSARPPVPDASVVQRRVVVVERRIDDVAQTDSVHHVSFDPFATHLGEGARRDLTILAGEVRERARLAAEAGMPPPRVSLVGDGVGRWADRVRGAVESLSGGAVTDRAGRPVNDVDRRRETGRARALAAAVFLREQLVGVSGVRVVHRAAVDAPDGVVPRPGRGVQVHVDAPLPRVVMGDPQGRHLADVPRRVHVPLLGDGTPDVVGALEMWIARTGDASAVHVWIDGARGLSGDAEGVLEGLGVTVRDVATDLPSGMRATDRILSHRIRVGSFAGVGMDVALSVLHAEGGIWADPAVRDAAGGPPVPLPATMPRMPGGVADGEPLFPLLTGRVPGLSGPVTGLLVAPPGSALLQTLLNSDRLGEDGFVVGRLLEHLDGRPVDLAAGADLGAVAALWTDFGSGRFVVDDHVLSPWTGREVPVPAAVPRRLLRVQSVGPDQRRALHALILSTAGVPAERRSEPSSRQLDATLQNRPEALHHGRAFAVQMGGRRYEVVVGIEQLPGTGPPAAKSDTTEQIRRGTDNLVEGRQVDGSWAVPIAGSGGSGLFIGGGVSVAGGDTVGHRTAKTVNNDVGFEAKHPPPSDVRLRFVVILRDESGAVVGPGPRVLDGHATGWFDEIPTTSGDAARAAVELDPTAGPALSGAAVLDIRADADQVLAALAEQLPPELQRPAAKGRGSLLHFLSESYLAHHFERFVTGWVRSDGIPVPGRPPVYVESRLVPKKGSLLDDVSGKVVKQRRVAWGIETSEISRRGVVAQVRGGWRLVPGLLFAHIGPRVAVSLHRHRLQSDNRMAMALIRRNHASPGAWDVDLVRETRVRWGATSDVAPPVRTPVEMVLADSTVNAQAAGLPVADVVRDAPRAEPRTDTLPPYMAAGLGIGRVIVHSLGAAPNRLRGRVAEIMAVAGGAFAELADGDGRHRTTTSASTVRELGSAWQVVDHHTTQAVLGTTANSLYDGGIDVLLKRDGVRHVDHLHLRIRATMDQVVDEGAVPGMTTKVGGGERTESQGGAGVDVDVSVAVLAALGFDAGVGYPGAGGRISGGGGHRDSSRGGPITGRRAVGGTTGPGHRVTGWNDFVVEAEVFRELSPLGRLTGVGAPGRHASSRTRVELPDASPIREPFVLDVPVDEMLPPGTPPHVQRVQGRPRITPKNPVAGWQRNFADTLAPDTRIDWIGGIRELRTAAELALDAAAGGDAVLGRGEDGRALESLLSPLRLSSDRALTEHGLSSPQQVHVRRWKDRRGTVVVTLRLYDPRVVTNSPTDGDSSVIVYGGYVTTSGSSNSWGAEARAGFEVSDPPPAGGELDRSPGPATGSGGVHGGYKVGAQVLMTRSTLGARDLFDEMTGQWRYRLRVHGVVGLEARSWETNQVLDLVRRPPQGTAKHYVDLPDHVFVSVTAGQMRVWGLLPEVEDRPHRAPVELHVPATLRGDHPVVGVGWPTDDGLRAPLEDIRERLAGHVTGRLNSDEIALITERLEGVSAGDLKGLYDSLGGEGVPFLASRPTFLLHNDLSAHLSFVPDTAPDAVRVEEVVHAGHTPRVEQNLVDRRSRTDARSSGSVLQFGGVLGGRDVGSGDDPSFSGGSGGLTASGSRAATGVDSDADTHRLWRHLKSDGPTAVIGQRGRLVLTIGRKGETIPGPESELFTRRHREPAALLSSLPDPAQPSPGRTRPAAPDGGAPRIDPDTVMATVGTDAVAMSRAVRRFLESTTTAVPDAFHRPGGPGRHQLDVRFSPEYLDAWISLMLAGPVELPQIAHPTQPGVALAPRISVTPVSLHTERVSATLSAGAGANFTTATQSALARSRSGDIGGAAAGEHRDSDGDRGDARADVEMGNSDGDRADQAPEGGREHNTKFGDSIRRLGGRFDWKIELILTRPGRPPSVLTVPTVTGTGMKLFLAEPHAAALLGPMPEPVREAMREEKKRAVAWRAADAVLVELQRRNDRLWLEAGPRGRDTPAGDRAAEVATIDADRRDAAVRFDEAARAWVEAKTDLDRLVHEWSSRGADRDAAVPLPPAPPVPSLPQRPAAAVPPPPAPPVPSLTQRPAAAGPVPAPVREETPPAVPHPSVPEVPTDAQAAAIGQAMEVYDRPSGPDEVREAYAQWRGRGEPMPRGGDWSLAAAVANPDPVGDGPGARAIGVEVEFQHHRLRNLAASVQSGEALAESAALTAVAEIGTSGMTLELVTQPAALLPGDDGRVAVEEIGAAVDGVLQRLAGLSPGSAGPTGSAPLARILPSPEYELTHEAEAVRIEPVSGADVVMLSPQYTVGTAVAGLTDLLTWLSDHPPESGGFAADAARLHLVDGLDLGRRVAEEMMADPAFAGRPPHTLAATRTAVHGTVAALYLQFAAMSQRLHAGGGVSLSKNFSAFNLRHFPDHVVEGTGPEGAAWLHRNTAPVMERFASTFRAFDPQGHRGDPDPDLLDRRLPPRWTSDSGESTATLREWLYGALGDDPQRRRVDPDEALGIRTTLPELDHNRAADGTPRLTPPAVVGEIRAYGRPSLDHGGISFSSAHDLRTGVREIGTASRAAYTAAQALLAQESLVAAPFAAPLTWAPVLRGGSLDAGLAAHETWRGSPRAAYGAAVTPLAAAVVAVENAFGAPLAPVGAGPEAFDAVVDRIRRAGHGADAIVHAYPEAAEPGRAYGRGDWVGPVRRVWNLVNHEGTVWLVDPRTGTATVAGPDPIPRIGRVFAVGADPDATPIRFTRDDAARTAPDDPDAQARPETGPDSGSPDPSRTWDPGPLWRTDATPAAPQLGDPLLPAQWEARRGDATPGTAHTELIRVLQHPDGTLSPQGNPVTVDVRRIEVEPGRWVRELTLPLRLVGDPAHVARATELAAQALRDHVDGRYTLPGGDQLHLRIEPTTRADANRVLVTSEPEYTGANSTSLHWRLEHLERGDDPAVAVGRTFHELLHRAGLPDRYQVPGAVLGGAPDGTGVMGTDWRSTLLTGADLARIDEVARQAPTHDLPLPATRDGAPPAPPAAEDPPVRSADGDPIAPESFDWGPTTRSDPPGDTGDPLGPETTDRSSDSAGTHGPGDAPRLTVAFDEGVHQVDATGRAAVQAATDRWIDDVVAARAEGRPTPALTVTGHGNGTRSASRAWADGTGAERTGLDRARDVESIARARLRARIVDGATVGLAERDFRIVATGTARPPWPGASPAERRVAVLGRDTTDVTGVDSVHDVPFHSSATRLDGAARRELMVIAEQVRERARLARDRGLPPPEVRLVGDDGGVTGHDLTTEAADYLRDLLADVEERVPVTAHSALDGIVPPSRGVRVLVEQPASAVGPSLHIGPGPGDTLSPATQTGPTTNADAVVAVGSGLLPHAPADADLVDLRHAVRDDVAALLDGAVVRVGQERLFVVAEPDWSAATPADRATDPAGASRESHLETSATTSSSRSPRTRWFFFVPAVPGLFGLGGVTLPTGASSHLTTTHSRAEKVAVTVTLPERSDGDSGFRGMRAVEVPLRFTLSRVDAAGVPVGPAVTVDGRSGDGPVSVGMTVPAGLHDTATPLPLPPALPPSLVEGAHVTPRLSRRLAEHIGSTSPFTLRALRTAVSADGIADQLPRMAVGPVQARSGAGWVDAASLLSDGDPLRTLLESRGRRLQLRAVAREVAYLETIEGASWSATTTDATTTARRTRSSRTVAGSLGVGPGIDVGVVTAAAGPFGGADRSAEVSHSRDRTTTHTSTQDRKAAVVRYRTVYDMQARIPGRTPIVVDRALTAEHWTTAEDAARTGLLPAPDGVPDPSPEVAESRMLAASETLAAIMRDSVAQLPGHHRWSWRDSTFVTSFDHTRLGGGISGRHERELGRSAAIEEAVSAERLPRITPDLLVDGPLTLDLDPEPGRAHDYHAALTLSARLVGELEDLGPAADTPSATRIGETVSDEYTAKRSWSITGGIIGRVYSQLAGNLALATYYGKAKYERSGSTTIGHNTRSDVGGVRGRRLGADGAPVAEPLHRYRSRVEYTVTGHHWSRRNAMVRGLTPGSAGRDVPTLHDLPVVDTGAEAAGRTPGTVVVDVVLELPAGSDAAAVRAELERTVTPVARTSLPAIPLDEHRELRRKLDGIRLLSAHGLEHIRESVRTQAVEASQDPALGFQDGANSGLIDTALSQRALRGDPRLFSRPVGVDGLAWKRRREDTRAAAAVSFSLRDPEVLETLWEQPSGAVTSGSTVARESERVWSMTHSVEPGAFATGDTDAIGGGTAQPVGLFLGEVVPWGVSSARRVGESAAAETTHDVSGEPRRLHLIRADLVSTVAAEASHRGNLDRWEVFGPAPVSRSAERFTLPGAVHALVTDAQLHTIRVLQAEEDARRATETGPPRLPELVLDPTPDAAFLTPPPRPEVEPVPAGRSLPAPNRVGSVLRPVDLGDTLPLLREQMVLRLGPERTERLLPSSAVTTPHDGHREANTLLTAMQGSLGDAVADGTVTALRLEDRLSGETYDLRVGAEPLAPPRPLGVTHGELTTTTVSRVSRTAARTLRRVLAEILMTAAPAGFFSPSAEAGTARHGAPFLAFGLGLAYVGEWLTQIRETAEAESTIRRSSEAKSGVLAVHGQEFVFDVRIERHGERVAAAPVIRTVEWWSLPEDTPVGRPPEHHRQVPASTVTARPVDEARPEALAAWRSADATTLPDDPARGRVVHFAGDIGELVRAAEQAIRAGGGSVDAATARAVKADLTPSRLTNSAREQLGEGMPLLIPTTAGLDLYLHAALPDSDDLHGASARIRLDGSTDRTGAEHVEFRSGSEHLVGAMPVLAGGVPHPPESSTYSQGREPFGQASGYGLGLEPLGVAGTEHEQRGVAASGGTERPADAAGDTAPISTLYAHATRFRFVAVPRSGTFASGRRTAVVDVVVDEGYLVRRNDRGGDLPASLVDAVRELSTRDQEWGRARARLRGMDAAPGIAAANDRSAAAQAERAAAGAWWSAKGTYDAELARTRGGSGLPEPVAPRGPAPVSWVSEAAPMWDGDAPAAPRPATPQSEIVAQVSDQGPDATSRDRAAGGTVTGPLPVEEVRALTATPPGSPTSATTGTIADPARPAPDGRFGSGPAGHAPTRSTRATPALTTIEEEPPPQPP
ncbi:hypothetical protein HX744_26690 [Pseudonocardia sp. ICBG1122]|nr:hypothetical protein [Pseudonocardia pini]